MREVRGEGKEGSDEEIHDDADDDNNDYTSIAIVTGGTQKTTIY